MSAPPRAYGVAIPGLSLDYSQQDTAMSEVSVPDVTLAVGNDGDDISSNGSLYNVDETVPDGDNAISGALSNKRKLSAEPNAQDDFQAKKVRLDAVPDADSPSQDRSRQVSAEIWHHIFTFLDPRALGVLLSVNKLFHTYLDPSVRIKAASPPISSTPILPLLEPDVIWQAARRNHWPKMPAPLKERTELEMWRIACSRSCQFCEIRGVADPAAPDDQWHRGPGVKGVSPIFPFFLASCGLCLSDKILKELDILLSSSTPSILIPGLPVVYMTSDLHVISPSTISSGGVPPVAVTKVYWPGHIDNLKRELEAVKSLGSAAAEEWFKGLDLRGKHALADSSRWEKWLQSGGVARMREPLPPNTIALPPQKGPWPLLEAVRTLQVSTGTQPWLPGLQKRTKEEVLELKAKRRTEIERRALLLEPPLLASVLAHIPSFQAALQIIAPLDDKAWDLLRPRLLAHREAAEQSEKDSTANSQALPGWSDPWSTMTEKQQPTPKQVTDSDWDEIQGPVRARISAYADEIIQNGWQDGEKVTKKTSPQFAAEALLYVRKRFYAEVGKDAAAAIASGKEPVIDPTEGPWTQKLTLENMKWVFDVKFKQLTERHRKELFLCNGCQGNTKFYGFEAVIQHYAAKHTSALSSGSVVVHWRAEWPEQPIFHPDPKQALAPKLANPINVVQQPPNTTQNPNSQSHGTLPGGVYPSPAEYYGYSMQNPYPMPIAYEAGPVPPVSQSGGHAPPQLIDQGNSLQPVLHGLPSRPFSCNQEPDPPYSASGVKSRSGPTPAQGLPVNAPSSGDAARRLFMAKVAKEIWFKMANAQQLSGVLRVCVTIHHVVEQYQAKFSEAAPLRIFLGALNLSDMKPIRQPRGFACKACATSSRARRERKTAGLHLPELVKHFNAEHSEGMQNQGLPPLDWRVDMISHNDMSALQGLSKVSRRIKKPVLKLIRAALPWAFGQTGSAVEGPKQPKAAKPVQQPSPRTVAHEEEDDDDPYSPPDSIGHGAQARDGRAGEEHQPQPHHASHSRNEADASQRQMEPAIKGERADSRPLVSGSNREGPPNLKPANVVYDKKDSKQFLRTNATKQNRAGGRPAVQAESNQPSRLAARDDERVPEAYSRQPRIPGLQETDLHYGNDRTVGHLHREDAYPREVRLFETYEPRPPRDYDDPYQQGRPALPQPVSTGILSLQPGGGYLPSDARETRVHPGYGEVQHVETRRVVREGAAVPDYAPRTVRYADEVIYAPQPRRPSIISPRYAPSDPYARGQYRERSPAPRYAQDSYPDNQGYAQFRAPPQEQLPPRRAPTRPVDPYELLEIRDPRGSFYIRRSTPLESANQFDYGARPVPRETQAPPQHLPPPPSPRDAHPVASLPATYDDGSRPASGMKTQHSGTDMEEYDPRNPAARYPPAGVNWALDAWWRRKEGRLE